METGIVHASDWFPTLLSAAGLEFDDDLDGVDQWERMKDPSVPEPREEMLYNLFVPGNNLYGVWDGIDSWPPISAIRVGNWKYIWRAYGFGGWSTEIMLTQIILMLNTDVQCGGGGAKLIVFIDIVYLGYL